MEEGFTTRLGVQAIEREWHRGRLPPTSARHGLNGPVEGKNSKIGAWQRISLGRVVRVARWVNGEVADAVNQTEMTSPCQIVDDVVTGGMTREGNGGAARARRDVLKGDGCWGTVVMVWLDARGECYSYGCHRGWPGRDAEQRGGRDSEATTPSSRAEPTRV